MPRSRADTASQSGNSVIERRRQRAEKRAYKERHAGPVSAQSTHSSEPEQTVAKGGERAFADTRPDGAVAPLPARSWSRR